VRPSRELLNTLADTLDIPLRARNDLDIAAGFAPPYPPMTADDDGFAEVMAALERILDSHEPLPGVIMDRHWDLVRANTAAQRLFSEMINLSTIEQPANVLRLMFGPLRSQVANWPEIATALLARARREAIGGIPDPQLQALLDELAPLVARQPRRYSESRHRSPSRCRSDVQVGRRFNHPCSARRASAR
jgi:hypothetical protein